MAGRRFVTDLFGHSVRWMSADRNSQFLTIAGNPEHYAGLLEVEIRYDNQHFRLRVRDDGKGMDSAALLGRKGHYGLRGMQERAKLIGGNLTVWSEPGMGTEVDLRVPLTPPTLPFTRLRGCREHLPQRPELNSGDHRDSQ